MSLTDWNDLHVDAGLDEVRRQLLPHGSACAEPVEEVSQHAPAESWGETPPIEAYEDDPEAWRSQLMRSDSGGLIGNHANAYLILSHDERWKGVLAYDEFSNKILKLRPPPYLGGKAGEWEDSDIGKALVWLQMEWRLPLKQPRAADEAARMVAADNRFHAVKDWLGQLPAWDGEPRLWSMLTVGFGADPNEYTSHIGTGCLVSAVARVMRPGCKVDTMLVLEGEQGLRKSTAILELFSPPWYLETSESPGAKDFLVTIQGAWVVEIGEMQSFSKADTNLVKQIIVRRDDKFRAPYDRYVSSHPRQCIFMGTTNADTYLQDPTGARRFLPFLCRAIDLEWIRANRDQLWAEALEEYRRGFRWWEFPEEQAKAEQDARFVGDSWEEPIARWLDGQGSHEQYPQKEFGDSRIMKVTTTQLLSYALRVELAKHTRQDQLRVAAIMRRMGWKQGPLERVGTARMRFYLRPQDSMPAQPPPVSQMKAA